MKWLALLPSLFAGGFLMCLQGNSEHRPGDGPPPEPFTALFDTDRDGEISAVEIVDAPKVLRTLDRNGDGSLTREELPRPPRPHHALDARFHQRPEQEGLPQRPAFQPPPPPSMQERDGFERPQSTQNDRAAKGTVMIEGGYETDPRDGGRPVGLIAAALGVEPQVFRDAFSKVRPAQFGPPTPWRAQANKQVLMDALGQHGVTNERLDEVSNYYRYRPESGRLWRHRPAKLEGVFEGESLVGVKVVDPGAGYLSVPILSVKGYDVAAKVKLAFGTDLAQNGSIESVELID